MTLRGLHLLPVAMFVGTFAWAFVCVSLPFHIREISTLDAAATLRWTGWILGISSLVTVATAPMWGRYAERGTPRALYMVVETLQGLAFFGMALARTLPELFLARLVLGFIGAASTFAFIIASRAGSPGAVRRQVAAIQSAMTVGQAALAAAASVWSYGALRFLQVLAIAPVFSARTGAGFIGPVLATTVLAWTSPELLYVLLGMVGLACVPLVRVRKLRVAL